MAENKSGGWFKKMREEAAERNAAWDARKAVETPELDAAVGNTGSKKSNIWTDLVVATKDAARDGSLTGTAQVQVGEGVDDYDYARLDRLSNKEYKDTGFGQFGANRTASRLSQDASLAWNTYLQSPNETNRKYAEAASKAAEQFQLKNTEALDDVNAKATLLTKDLAGYLPQLKDQTVASLGGRLLTAPFGLGKYGAAAARGAYSADVMRGAAFKTLTDLGIDEDTALRAASDEAFIAGLLDSADALLEFGLMGTNKFFKTLGGVATGAAAETAKDVASQSLIKKMLKGLGKYGLNITEEGLQEGLQQAISIANSERVASGDADSGKLDLAKRALSLYWDRLKGEASAENTAEIKAAEKGGARLAALLGGLEMAGTNLSTRSLQQQMQPAPAQQQEANNPVADVLTAEKQKTTQGTTTQQPNDVVDALFGEEQRTAPEPVPSVIEDVQDAVADWMEDEHFDPQPSYTGEAGGFAFNAIRGEDGFTVTVLKDGAVVGSQSVQSLTEVPKAVDSVVQTQSQWREQQGPQVQQEQQAQQEQQPQSEQAPPEQGSNDFRAEGYSEGGKASSNFGQSTEGQPGGTERTSQTPTTVRNSRVTTEEMRDIIDRKGSAGRYNYWAITNDETVQKASETIAREGWDTAYANWIKAVNDGKAGDQITAIGAILYNHALSAGNEELASDILCVYQEALRNTARGLQAGKIIQSLSPDSRLYMIQRSISRYASDLGLDNDIVLSDEVKKAYREAKTEAERDAVVTQMQEEVAAQMPTTWLERWNALRYVNMLGNFKTQGRNLAGNATSRALSGMRNAVRTFIESIVYAKDPSKRTSSYFAGEHKAVGRRDFRNTMGDIVMGDNKYSDNSPQGFMRGVQEKKRIFRSSLMENYRKVTNKAMQKGDQIFSEEAYGRAIGGWMKAKGISVEKFSAMLDAEEAGTISKTDAKLLEDGRMFAVQEAQEITFRDDNAFSKWISKAGRGKDTPKAVRVLSEGLLPFRKTPANVLVRATEYSPIGLIETAYKAVQMNKPGSEITSTDIINSLSKSLTGTGLFIIGSALKNSGWLTGGEDDEKQAGFDDLRGSQDWALFLPDGTNFTMDWASSVAFPLFMGAEFAAAVGEDGVQWADLDDAMMSIADPLLEFSMMQGINDTLSNVKYSDNSLMQMAAQTAVSYLTQGLTNSLLGQFERTFEGGNRGRKETFVDKDSGIPAWLQRSIGKASAKTPGLDYQQVDYIDAWGRTQDYENPLLNGLGQFLSPGYVSTDRSTAVDDELQRLYDAGKTTVFPQRFGQSDEITLYDADGKSVGKRHLTAEEYEQFNRTMGQTRLELTEALVKSSQYKAMDDAEKAKAIGNIYEYGKALAKLEVEPNTKVDSWVKEAMASSDPAKYIGLYSAAQNLEPWGDSESVSPWQKVKYVAESAGEDADEFIPMFFSTNSNYPKKYELARERGYSAERFAEFYEAFSTIESDRDANGKSLKNVRKKVIKHLVDAGWPEQYANEMYNLFNTDDKNKLNDWSW